jgi:hypothetical protein
MPTNRLGETDDRALESRESLSVSLRNLRYWIGELVLENHRLRMAMRERAFDRLFQENDNAFHRDALFSPPSIKKMHGTSLS